MTVISEHPAEDVLTRYVEGVATAQARAEIAAHLEACAECAADVEFAYASARRARRLRDAVAPADASLRERIHASVALAAARPRGRRRAVWLGAAAAAAIVLAVIAALLRRPEPLVAAATSGELRFAPSLPAPGDSVTVTYTPSAALAREGRLRLRARWRAAADLPVWLDGPNYTVASLHPDGRGRFRGRFRLPDSVVFGAFAVESAAGGRVDAAGGRLWELLTRDASGQPSYESLEQSHSDISGRDWEQGYARARRAVELHPDRVRGWYVLSFFQNQLRARASESEIAGHRARFVEFDRRLRASAAPRVDDIGAMAVYAQTLGDTARHRYWSSRMLREAPASLFAVEARTMALVDRGRANPARVVAGLDTLYEELRGAHLGMYAWTALETAQAAGDANALLRWTDRALTLPAVREEPGSATRLAAGLTRVPALREEGMRRLRVIAASATRAHRTARPLDRSVTEDHPRREGVRRAALAALAAALDAQGQPRAALDTLVLAARSGWDAGLQRRAAGRLLVAGDTAAAMPLLAAAASDPGFGVALADSIAALLGPRFDGASWGELVRSATTQRRSEIAGRGERRTLPPRVRLEGSAGDTATLGRLANGRPTLVAFWSRSCPPAVAELASLDRLARALAARGYATITVASGPPSPESRAFVSERGLSFPVYHDSWQEARLAFDQWSTPSYYVIDGTGRLRFARTDLASAAAQLDAVDDRRVAPNAR